MESNFTFQQAVNEACKSESRQKNSWYGSDMGKCLAGAYWARMGREGLPKEERTLRIFKCGNLFEDFVLDSAAKFIKVERPETINMPEFDLRVRPDAIVEVGGKNLVYEIKSVNSKKFWWMEKKKEGPDRHYLQQLWWGLKATGIEEGRLLYVSKDDLVVVEYILRLDDPVISAACLNEIAILQEAWRTKTPPPPAPTLDKKGKINWLARYCDYHQHCTGDKDWLSKAANIKDDTEI